MKIIANMQNLLLIIVGFCGGVIFTATILARYAK